MRLSLVTTVVLRLFSIYWLVSALISGLAMIPFAFRSHGVVSSRLIETLIGFAVPGTYAVLALLIWLVADKVVGAVVGGNDPELHALGIDASNLYAFGFVVVGLVFFLSHLGSMVGWIHYIGTTPGSPLLDERSGVSVYEVLSQTLPCGGGLGAVILAPRLGRTLATKWSK